MNARVLSAIAFALGVIAVSSAASVPKAVIEPEPTREQYEELHKQFCSISGFNTIYGFGPYLRVILHSAPREDELPNFPDVPFSHEMELNCSKLSAEGFRQLKPTRKLRTLVLSRPEQVEAALDHLTKFDGLDRLGLEGGFTDAALKLVATLERLTELDLTVTHATADGLKQLKGMKRLTRLGLRGAAVTDDLIAALAGQKELTHLDLDDTSVTDAGLKHLRAFPKLQSVRLRGQRDLTVEGMTTLATLPELTAVSLPQASKFDDEKLLLFAKSKKLTALSAHTSELTDAGVSQFLKDAPTTLNKLSLHNHSGGSVKKLTDAGTVGLDRLEHMTELEFWGSQVGTGTLERAAKLKKLTHLSVYGSLNVTDDGVKLLRGLEHLEVLNLSCTGVTFKTLDEVANWKHLKRLALMLFYGYGELTEEGVERLRKARPDLAIGSEGS